jgi:hypothetical protein
MNPAGISGGGGGSAYSHSTLIHFRRGLSIEAFGTDCVCGKDTEHKSQACTRRQAKVIAVRFTLIYFTIQIYN